MRSDGTAGHRVTIKGTADPGEKVVVRGHDKRHGKYRLGRATPSDTGHWRLRLADGVSYNTVARAFQGSEKSNRAHIDVHQVLRIDGHNGRCHYKTGKHCAISLVRHDADGFHYKLTGSSRSKVPGERIVVRRHGHVLGHGRMHRDGTFTVHFTTGKRTPNGLVLRGNGKDRDGVRWVLSGHRRFHVHD